MSRKYKFIMETASEKVEKKSEEIRTKIENDCDVSDDILEMRDTLCDSEEYVPLTMTSMEAVIETLKSFVSILAQLQKTRIATNNRIYAAIATTYNLSNDATHLDDGIPELIIGDDGIPVDTDKKKNKGLSKKIIKTLRDEYNTINNTILKDIYNNPKYKEYSNINLSFASFSMAKRTLVNNAIRKLLNYPEDHINLTYIRTFPLYALFKTFVEFEEMEKRHLDQLTSLIDEIPVYKYYLKYIPGCGPTMSACMIAKLDYTKDTVSKWIKYCGIDVVINPETGVGTGRTKNKEHQILRDCKRKDGTIEPKWSITYEPWIKSKLLGVLPSTIGKAYGQSVKSGSGNEKYNFYWKIWLDYKYRIENDPAKKVTKIIETVTKTGRVGKPKEVPLYPSGRIVKMCNRYMAKWFLIDLYVNWRAIEGLTSREPYQDEKLRNDDGSKHVSKIRTVDYSDPSNPVLVEIPWNEHDDPRYICSSKFDRNLLV